MLAWQTGATAVAVGVCVAALLQVLWQRPRRDADLLLALVSGSLALSLLAPWLGHAPGWMQWALAIGGSATCNGYWLLSRALFRGEGAVGRVPVAVAAGVALMIAGYRGSVLDAASTPSLWTLALGGFLSLASSGLLVLSLLEALRGWSADWPLAERRLRIAYVLLFGCCIASTTLLSALADRWPGGHGLRLGVIALCATAMILFTVFALRHRRRLPMPWTPAPTDVIASPTPAPGADELRLIEALRHQLDVLQVYREPELKVADLASRLGIAEHRLSRLIGQHLEAKNFSQLINRHRIAHACRLLAAADHRASILDISGDSGFASLGPFNRAFKAAMGCTPSAFRARESGRGAHPADAAALDCAAEG